MAENLFGWHPDRQATEEFLFKLKRPMLGLALDDDVRDDPPRSVWFWDAEVFLFGQTLKAHNQEIGDCVSHGWGRNVQDLLFMKLMADQKASGDQAGPAERAYQICTEGIYGLSRVEIGQRRLGHGDGSVGAWAAEAVKQYGVIERKNFAHEGINVSQYSGRRAKSWGWDGMPDDLEDDARKHPVKTVSMVTNADDARAAIQNRYPIPVCSGQGFRTTRRSDGTGICDPYGTWYHCMATRGFMILKGGRQVMTIQQSWGNSPGGPDKVELETGEVIKLPQGCFNVEMDVYNRMLSRSPDSFAMSGGTGFTRQ